MAASELASATRWNWFRIAVALVGLLDVQALKATQARHSHSRIS
jgi:hypothetical protein